MLTTCQVLLVHYLIQSLQLLPEINTSVIYNLQLETEVIQNSALLISHPFFPTHHPDHQLAWDLQKGILEIAWNFLQDIEHSRSLTPERFETIHQLRAVVAQGISDSSVPTSFSTGECQTTPGPLQRGNWKNNDSPEKNKQSSAKEPNRLFFNCKAQPPIFLVNNLEWL